METCESGGGIRQCPLRDTGNVSASLAGRLVGLAAACWQDRKWLKRGGNKAVKDARRLLADLFTLVSLRFIVAASKLSTVCSWGSWFTKSNSFQVFEIFFCWLAVRLARLLFVLSFRFVCIFWVVGRRLDLGHPRAWGGQNLQPLKTSEFRNYLIHWFH